jgi:hypothetical protein
MVNRTRIRVGYNAPYKNLYYGMDVMLMNFDVEMVPIEVAQCETHMGTWRPVSVSGE